MEDGGSDPRLQGLLSWAEQKWGRGALVRLGDAAEQVAIETIRTGFPALDAALGIGGLPCGRISEIFGPDASGKQALVAHLVVQCQHTEGVAAYVDPGRRLDLDQMRAVGVDPPSLLVARPWDRLQAMEMAIRLARGGGVKLLVLDLGGPGDGEMGGRGDGERGRGDAGTRGRGGRYPALSTQHSLLLRRLVAAVDRNQVAFLFITRVAGDKPLPYGSRFSEPRTQNPEPGAGSPAALRFFASVRLGMERREWIRRGRDVIGCRTLVRVAKNKLAPPLKEAELDLLFRRFPPAAPVLQIQESAWEDRAGSIEGEERTEAPAYLCVGA